MSEILKKALKAVQELTPQQKDRVGENILAMLELETATDIPPEHREDVDAGLAEAERGDFATAEEVEAAYRNFTA